ncbi:MAG: LysR substrate-binding domain-containing protein [Dermatophilaceae bacterium]
MIEAAALRALTMIAATGSVAAAADGLGYTPSAVSQQVKRLEAQVGVPLLERAGRGVILTAPGKALAANAPEVFAAMERAVDAARSRSAQPTGTLRVAAFSTAVRGLLVPRLPTLATRHPLLRVSIDEADPDQAAHALSAGTADAAILHDAADLPGLPSGLRIEPVHLDAGDVIVRDDHPLAASHSVTAADLAGYAWVTSPPGTACYDWFQRLFADRPRPEVRHRVDDFSTQVALVAAGGAIALVPRLGRPPLPPGLRPVAVEPLPTRSVELAWRVSSADNPAVAALLDVLRPSDVAPREPSSY